MKWFSKLFGLTLPLIAQAAQAQTVASPYEISNATLRMDSRGGCEIELVMENKYNETLEVAGKAYMVNDEGMTIGSTYLSFPPAIVGGKSSEKGNFYSSSIAGGVCPKSSRVILDVNYCKITGTSYSIKDVYCNKKFEFIFKFQ